MDELSSTHPLMSDQEAPTAYLSPLITGMEEVKNTASLTYSIVQKAADEEGLQRLGKVWYRVIL